MDLDKMCSYAFSEEDEIDGRRRGFDKDHLKLKVNKRHDGTPDITWSSLEALEEFQGPARKINVENKTGGADVFSNVKTTRDNEMVIHVTLKSGHLKGYNREMRLPLPRELQSLLGETVAIDPGKNKSEFKDKITIETISGHDIPPVAGATAQSATATIRSKQGHYQGHFSCEVILTGTVQKEGNSGAVDQMDIVEICRINEIPGIQEGAKGVPWTMKGYCDITWDFEQTVTWEPIQAVTN